jgi:hypothetical protein
MGTLWVTYGTELTQLASMVTAVTIAVWYVRSALAKFELAIERFDATLHAVSRQVGDNTEFRKEQAGLLSKRDIEVAKLQVQMDTVHQRIVSEMIPMLNRLENSMGAKG